MEFRDFTFCNLYTVIDLFRAQCTKDRLVLVNILVEKSSPFSAPHHADVFPQNFVKAISMGTSIYDSVCGVKVLCEQKLILIHYIFFSLGGSTRFSA